MGRVQDKQIGHPFPTHRLPNKVDITFMQAGKKPGRLGAGLPANLAPRGRILRSRGKILGSRGTILGSLGKFLNSRRHIKVRQSPLSQ